uniref:NDUFA4 mitochondrial complex associated like 2 n=1 Tax=Gadus morhua TaxID=8049 RepID=A0A8C4Z7X1_GADMO
PRADSPPRHATRTPCIWMRLIPQFFFLTLGMAGAFVYLLRLARGPHVTLWDKRNNPEPWNKLDPTYQYKVGWTPRTTDANEVFLL